MSVHVVAARRPRPLAVRMPGRRFRNRADAGVRLAAILGDVMGPDDLVLGLPRGGVIVAASAAAALQAKLDVYVVRKIGSSVSPEFAIGAIAEDGPPLLDRARSINCGSSLRSSKTRFGPSDEEIARQVDIFRGTAHAIAQRAEQSLLVDDGIATGATVRAAVVGVRTHEPSKIVVAAPVASQGSIQEPRCGSRRSPRPRVPVRLLRRGPVLRQLRSGHGRGVLRRPCECDRERPR